MTALSSLVEANTKRVLRVADEVAARVGPRTVALERAIDAERKTMTTHAGQRLSYYVSHPERTAAPNGNGSHAGASPRPLVLLHSVNACASSYEMRPLFERYRHDRPTYALDLPGFGFSGREDRPYTTDLYVSSVREFLARVKDRDGAADVVTLSLSGEFAAHVAATRKDLIHSLALISPTGFGAEAPRAPARARAHEQWQKLLRTPVVSRVLFDVVASRPSIRFFLKKVFVGRPDEGLVDYDYATSHQPDAFHAPIAFLAGDPFTPDVRETVYAHVTVPSLVAYDTDPFTGFDALPEFVGRHASWSSVRVRPSRGMPQFERLEMLSGALERFWSHGVHAVQ